MNQPQGQYRARLRHFDEGNPNRHGGSLQAGPIAGPKIPLVMMLLKVLVFRYPSAIDLGLGTVAENRTGAATWTSSTTIPFLVAGFLDYALIIAVANTFSVTLGWVLQPIFPDTDLYSLFLTYAQPACYCITLWYRLRIAGRTPVLKSLRASYRQVLGSIKIFLVVFRVWPAIAWYIAIDRILGPNARKKMGLLVLQICITLYTGFWDDSAVQLSRIFADGEEKSKLSPAKNETLGWSGIFTKALGNTVTYVPIELFVGAIPALLLLAHSGGLPRAIPWLGSLPIERWAEEVDRRWVALWGKLPGHHAVNEAEVKRLKDTHGSKAGETPRFIRLLRVEAGLFEDTVHCSLEWYDLDKRPKYKAISYAWGSSKLEETIILNGKKKAVIKSAFSALMAVRSEWRSRLFWVDALCIDQTDKEDKARQIPFMSDVFHKAHKVIVWLGPAPGSDGSLALSAIHKLWTSITFHIEFGGPFEVNDIPAPVWDLVRQMLLAPWFQRTWVVQEVVLARGEGSHTIIRYGDGSLDWQTLSWFIRNIRNYPPILNRLLGPVPAVNPDISSCPLKDRTNDPIVSIIRNLEAIQDFSTITFRGAMGISLMYYMTRMFRTACAFQTTETKDRVYAVLGLPDERTMSPAVANVDYEGQTTEELFTKVAIHTLHDERIKPPCRIDFLAHAGISFSPLAQPTSEYPSWVPNWNITSSLGNKVPRPFLGLDGFRELVQGHMDYCFCRSIADMKCYGDINWGYEPYGPFHKEHMDLLGKRLIETRKAFYKAGIPPTYIDKKNGVSEAEPKFEVIYPPISPAGGPVGLPKLKIKGVQAGRVAHLAKTAFTDPQREQEIIYLPKAARRDGKETEMEEYLNPSAFLPPDWRPLALRYGTHYSGADLLFAFTRTILGDVTRHEIDLKHAAGVPTRPAPETTVVEVLGYEKLIRGYLGYSEKLFDLQDLEQDLIQPPNGNRDTDKRLEPILLKNIIAAGPPVPVPPPEGGEAPLTSEEFAWVALQGVITLNKMVSHACGNRIFGVTGGGKIGLFPIGTRVDDVVVVFWGSMVPFVLRRVKAPAGDDDLGSYQLVGACYVHGIMDGEALDGVELGGGEEFVLV